MKIRTIIIDDEVRGLKIIEHFVSSNNDIEIIASISDAEEAIEVINKMKPQLIILDIHIPKFNGFEILERVNFREFKTIFVTAYNEYAIKSFKYSAIDYLLKPLDEVLFSDAIKKVVEQINQTNIKTDLKTLIHNVTSIKDPMAMKICIQHMNGFNIIDSQDIIYCEADTCYTIFKMAGNKQIVSSKTMAEYESILDPGLFLRIHRSFIINLSRIKEYRKGLGGSVIMDNGAELEISRRKKDEFVNRIKKIFKDESSS
ncbi:MAG: response regulator transcription factor [Saprospiraceae bacterium]|jgi:two-component system LytT family response regulator|nr:response regulator transcription factor [Saprospiraceae bacterium]